MECIFCSIASKKIKSTIVHETERIIVIKDISPQAPNHLLVLPKEHFETILDCTDRDLMGEMLEVASVAAKKIGMAERGFRTIINTNDEGGQTVFHMHMHLLAGRALNGKMG